LYKRERDSSKRWGATAVNSVPYSAATTAAAEKTRVKV
jgi:hypothetical protein